MEVLKEMPPRNPINGTFELTVRCNLKCKMCLFRHDDSENAEIINNEKTAEEWIDMARQVSEAGTINLLITGGEPMLRPDFCEIYEGIYKQGFIITLYTNATLVTPKIMETLRKYPPHRIGVTIYGASEETYEKVCGNKKAYEKTIRGIDLLMTLPSTMEFRTTIIKDNYNDIYNIESFIKERYGEIYNLTHTRMVLKSVRGGSADVESCRLTPKENIDLFFNRGIKSFEEILGKKFVKSNKKLDINKLKFEVNNTLEKNRENLSLLGCDAGMNSYTISWDGKLLGCQLLGTFFTEAFADGFNKSWSEYPLKIKLPQINSKCAKCESARLCSACYASRFIETGDLGGCPEYSCEDTKELIKFL